MTTAAKSSPANSLNERYAEMSRFLTWVFPGNPEGKKIKVATSKAGKFSPELVDLTDHDVLEGLLKSAETHNVFICSAQFKSDAEGYKAKDVLSSRTVWVDIDPPQLSEKDEHGYKVIDLAKMRDHEAAVKEFTAEWKKLGALIVHSGSRGGRHVRFRVNRDLTPLELEALNRLARDRYHGDNKQSPESVLRLPGTFNHKRGKKTPVRILHLVRKSPGTPEALAASLGCKGDFADYVAAGSVAAGQATTDEGVKFNTKSDRYNALMAGIKYRNQQFEEGELASRFLCTLGIVKDCIAAGLTLDNAIYAARLCKPLVDKDENSQYDLVADVSRVWVKEGGAKVRVAPKAPDTFRSSPTPAVEVPVFPIGALSGRLRQYVEAVAKAYQVPVEYVAGMCFTALSIASGRGWYVSRMGKEWTEALVIWTMFLSGPSTRKSPPMKEVMAPIRAIQSDKRGVHHSTEFIRKAQAKKAQKDLDNISDLDSGEGGHKIDLSNPTSADLIQIALLEELVRLGKAPEPTLIANDVTVQKLGADLAANNGIMCVVDDESTYLRNMAGLYSGGQAEVAGPNKAYDEGEWEISRKGSEGKIKVHKAFMPTGIAAQPDVVSEIVAKSPALLSSGFIARFLLCMPRAAREGDYNSRQEYSIPPSLRAWWMKTIQGISRHSDDIRAEHRQVAITLDDEALAVFQVWDDLARDKMPHRGEYAIAAENLGKLPGVTLRLAGLLCVLNGTEEISKTEMESSVEISKFYAQQAVRVLTYFNTNRIRKTVISQAPEVQNELVLKIANAAKINQKLIEMEVFTPSKFHAILKGSLKGTPYERSADFIRDLWPQIVHADVVEETEDDRGKTKYQLKGK